MESKLLSSVPHLLYGFSTRADGTMLIQDPASADNRRIFFQGLGIPLERTAAVVGVHGTRVQQVPVSEARPLRFPQTDGLYTLDPSRVLTVTGADCFPVFVVDPVNRVTGLCHAGWKGAIDGILPVLITQLTKAFHSNVQDLFVVIGPGIRACHFEVKLDVWSKVPEMYHIQRENKRFVDLPTLLQDQVMAVGVLSNHIEDTGICTVCDERYFSYRRDKPKDLQAQVAYLGWKL